MEPTAKFTKQIAISVGGSGARTAEALIYLCAAGLGPKEMTLIFVDADTSNGSLKKVVELAHRYQALQAASPDECPLFQTRLELGNPSIWSPFPSGQGQPKLGTFFDLSGLLALPSSSGLGRVMEALFTEDQRTASLDDGFLGKPSIGAAVLSHAVKNSTPPWTDVLTAMKTGAGSGEQVSVFCMGSIFGGTGASGIPTIPKLLLNSIDHGRANVCFGAALLLPYFDFPVPSDVAETGRVFASPSTFLLNTKEALRHYHSLGDLFSRLYLLGTTKLATQKNFKKGGEHQDNLPHFVELVAASGATDFFDNARPSERTIRLAMVESDAAFRWSDYPDQENRPARPALADLSRVCFLYLSKVMPRLRDIKSDVRGAKRTPWYQHLIARRQLSLSTESEWRFFEDFEVFSKRFLVWLKDMQVNHGDMHLELAQTSAVTGLDASPGPAKLNESNFRGTLISDSGRVQLWDMWARLCEQESKGRSRLANHRAFEAALYAAAKGD